MSLFLSPWLTWAHYWLAIVKIFGCLNVRYVKCRPRSHQLFTVSCMVYKCHKILLKLDVNYLYSFHISKLFCTFSTIKRYWKVFNFYAKLFEKELWIWKFLSFLKFGAHQKAKMFEALDIFKQFLCEITAKRRVTFSLITSFLLKFNCLPNFDENILT